MLPIPEDRCAGSPVECEEQVGYFCLDFVNSEYRDGYGNLTDYLDRPEWVARLFELWGMQAGLGVRADYVEELRALRRLLRHIVETLDKGNAPGEADIERLNAVLAMAPVTRHLTGDGAGYEVELVSTRDEVGLMGEMAFSAAELIANHRGRVKVCANSGCRYAFYDTSKSNNRRWCRDQGCSNRDRVRRFRALHQTAK